MSRAASPRAAAVIPAPADKTLRTSFSMTRPPGPVPSWIAERGRPSSRAKAFARGLTAEAGPRTAAPSLMPCGVGFSSTALTTEAAAGEAEAGEAVTGAVSAVPARPSSPSPAAPIIAIASRTGTSSPSALRILRIVPPVPAGTSMVALSVSISQRTVSAVTFCPSETFHLTMMQDSTVFPSFGITTV